MGTISSGMGLMSGMDIEAIVTQLMAIETRPRELLVTRIEENTTDQTALMALQARVMALQVAAANFNKESVFQQRTVASSNEDVLTATANQFAPLGNFQFTVQQLATTQNMISRGYAGLNSSLGTGTISIETQKAQIARPTDLSFINGQQGFYRGTLNITDRAGNDAQIDLSYALTLQDAIDAINDSTEVNVTASVSGDSLVITDDNVAPTGTMTITGSTAASLGIEGATAAGASQIVGADILYLTGETAFRQLNDGNGVRGFGFGDDFIFKNDGNDLFSVDLRDVLYREFGAVDSADNSSTLRSLNGGAGIRLGEFRITDQNGHSVDIDISELEPIYGPNTTLGHLETFIQTKIDEKNQQLDENYDPLDDATDFAGMMKMSISFHGSDHLTLTDNSAAFGTAVDSTERVSHFIIEDLDGGSAAADLGIVDDVSGGNIHGEQIWRMETVGDIVNAVNNHWDNWDDTIAGDDKRLVSVGLDTAGEGLTLSYQGTGTLTIDNTAAAADLGLANTQGVTGSFTGRRLIAGLNTVMLRSLNGGSAGTDQITSGSVINLTDRAGTTASVDLTNAYTVQQVIDAINAAGTNIIATVNDKGNGMVLADKSATSGYIEVSGELAEKLNIAVTTAEAVGAVDSGNLQLQYINEGTSLDELRQGSGIRRGEFTITDSTGRNWKIDLDQTRIETLQDVIDEINNQQVQTGGFGAGEDPVYQRITVRANINETGDGILLYDLTEDSSGNPIANPQMLKVTDEDGGHVAGDLGFLQAAKQDAQGKYFIDGSYEYKFEMGGGDTIEDLVCRINEADIGLNASIINDGSESNPYRISFNGENTGREGAMYLDAGTTNLTTHSLTEARDAVLLYGQPNQENPILITSSSNTVKDVIKGTTLELHSTSDSVVSINIEDDIEGIVAQMTGFVEAYNSIMADIAQLDSFNPDTLERGILFGDRTVDSIRRTLETLVYRNVPGLSNTLNGLNDVGIKFAPLGFETAPDENGETRNYTIATMPKIEFDEEKFRAAYAQDSQGVAELFTKKDDGIGDYIAEQLNRLAASGESTISHRIDSMQSRQDNFEDRIESLDQLLEAKEARLYKQFYAMEQALASMQSQQAALGSLASLAASMQG